MTIESVTYFVVIYSLEYYANGSSDQTVVNAGVDDCHGIERINKIEDDSFALVPFTALSRVRKNQFRGSRNDAMTQRRKDSQSPLGGGQRLASRTIGQGVGELNE